MYGRAIPHASLVIAWSKLPVGMQRSDSWTLTDLYKAYTGKELVNDASELERDEVTELEKALKTADRERRIYEAREFLKQHEGS